MLRNTVFTVLLLLVLAASGMAGDFQILHSFDGTNGAVPYGSVIYDSGKLYGTTVKTNSTSVMGTVFSLDIDGSGFTVLKSFTDSVEGENVYNGLTLYDGSLYGVTRIGGSNSKGTLFKINTNGSDFEIAHSFAGGTDGANPYSAPAVYNGNLYGLTFIGGDSNVGTIYKYSPTTETSQTLYSFSNPGCKPFGSLTSIGEYLYGMTSDHRSTTAYGNIFRYKPSDGTYEVMHEFTGTTAGGYPYDSLTWDGGNWVYGTTLGFYTWVGDKYYEEGISDEGVVFRLNISTNEYQIIHDFSAQSGDGAKPNSSMLIGDDGWLYGISHGSETWGGTEFGTFYRMQPDGSEFEVLHTFDSMADGDVPMRSLVMVDGIIYGTTAYGGMGEDEGYGTVWSYDTTTIPEPTMIAILSASLLGLIRKRSSRGKNEKN